MLKKKPKTQIQQVSMVLSGGEGGYGCNQISARSALLAFLTLISLFNQVTFYASVPSLAISYEICN